MKDFIKLIAGLGSLIGVILIIVLLVAGWEPTSVKVKTGLVDVELEPGNEEAEVNPVSTLDDPSLVQDTVPGGTPQPTKFVVSIGTNESVDLFNNNLNVTCDLFGETHIPFIVDKVNVWITVKSPGYTKESFRNLEVGDSVVYQGANKYEILYTDYSYERQGVFGGYKAELVITKVE